MSAAAGLSSSFTFRKVTPLLPLSPKFNSAHTSKLVSPNHSTLITNQTPRNSPKSLSSNDLEEAVGSFYRMLNSSYAPSIYSLNKLLGSIVKMGEYQTVLSLIQEMQLSGVEVDACTINIAINCYCHLNRVDFGFALLGTIFKRGDLPDVVTFNTMMKGLFAQDKFSEASNLFLKLLRDKHIEPSVFTYGTVINGLCKSGNTGAAIELLMSVGKYNFDANRIVHSYNAIIDSLCKDKMVSDAMSLFAEMIEKGISPTDVTYNSLIQGLCNFGQWEEATRLLREMLERKVLPNVHTFSILIDAFCKEGMVQEAEVVLEVMIQRGEVPDLVTYTALMDGYCLRGQMGEARKVFEHMVNRGLGPNVISYNILINGYCNKRRIDEGIRLFNEMMAKGLKPNVHIYTVMIDGLCRDRLFDEAKELLVRMEECGCVPNDVTYNVIVQGFLKGSQYYEALLLMEKMVERGFSPDASTILLLVDIL